MKRFFGLFAFMIWFFGMISPLHADMLAIVINESDLPINLGPDNLANSPDNLTNSPDNLGNSVDNLGNSPDNLSNSPNNFENGINGNRRIISPDNKFMGYYTFGQNGIINIYSYRGERIAYIPGGGHTQSIFFSQGGWCGTMGNSNGQMVFGFTQQCFARFFM